MFKHHNVNLALFDIRIKSPHKDLLLLRGNEFEVDSVFLEGSVKICIPNDMHVKKIRLNLIGEYNVDFLNKTADGFPEQVFDRLCVLKVEWSNLLTSPEGNILFGTYGDNFMNYYKSEHMKKHKSRNGSVDETSHGSSTTLHSAERPALTYSNSSPHLKNQPASKILIPQSGVDGTPFENVQTSSHNSFLLPKGNYNLPFKIYLPANISETVEGLPSANLLYRMSCTIERGRFEKPITTTKLIRIVRTLHPQNLNLSDSIDINNTWPGKVQYSVNIPKKGVAIGSTVPINILIVPIAKGLTLKAISGSIVEHFHVVHSEGTSPEWELVLAKQQLHIPDPDTLGLDQWVIKTHFKVPDNLKNINQTCDLKNHIIQVKHRIRLSIQLKNQSGHVSELRANLPVYVYVSATTGHVIGKHYSLDSKSGYFSEDKSKEDIYFKKDKERHNSSTSSVSSLNGRTAQESDEYEEDNDLDAKEDAPPLYQQHVFDKIYDMNNPQSPIEQFRIQSAEASPLNSMPGSSANLDSYFDIPKASSSDMIANHVNSITKKLSGASISSSDTGKGKCPDLNLLSKVPSYNDALSDDDDSGAAEPAPLYEGNNSPSIILSRSMSSMDITKKRPVMKKGHSHTHLFGRHSVLAPLSHSSESNLVSLANEHSHKHIGFKLKPKKK